MLTRFSGYVVVQHPCPKGRMIFWEKNNTIWISGPPGLVSAQGRAAALGFHQNASFERGKGPGKTPKKMSHPTLVRVHVWHADPGLRPFTPRRSLRCATREPAPYPHESPKNLSFNVRLDEPSPFLSSAKLVRDGE